MSGKVKKRSADLPVIIISGASGFIGRHFLNALCEDFCIYALARRPQKTSDVPFHENISWFRVDIANRTDLDRVIYKISENGKVDYFLHMAAFFDVQNMHDPEYKRTNVLGTKNILEAAAKLNLKRFIHASSLAIFEITDPLRVIKEDSTPDATFPYAKTKRKSEQFVKEYSAKFPCTVMRFAAIYSDWCEHLPLYSFLSTWLSKGWDHRILAGKGSSSIPYLHVKDLVKLFYCIVNKTASLPRFHNVTASPDQKTSHRELFQIANTYNYYYDIKPIFLPKYLAAIGLAMRILIGHITRKPPFERLWMIKYVTLQMNVDASHTRELLSWEPTKRYIINRRLLYLIWQMKTNPFEWHYRNKMRFHAVAERQYLKIYELMLKLKNSIIKETTWRILSPKNTVQFPTYQKFSAEEMIQRVEYIFKMLEFDICTGDRSHILDFARILAKQRYKENFPAQEVMNAVDQTAKVIIEFLLQEAELHVMKQRVYDEIMLTLQMVKDEIEDCYERLAENPHL